jgi:acetoin utilization protein AcuC
MTKPLLIGSEIYRSSRYAANHPLSIPRVSTTLDLIRALGWVEPENYLTSPIATPAELARFHDPHYIEALQRVEATQEASEAERARYSLGANGNPLFAEMFRRPATSCGASIAAADLLVAGERDTIYSPAGGTHHGRPDRASGFCYFNDPVLAILRLLDRGVERVLYVDLDAHHGDGVEAAFAGDPRVFLISVHEAGRWPNTGLAEDRAGGNARNFPVPAGFTDTELDYLVDQAFLPLGRAFEPEALVIQGGADALADDPLSKLTIGNRALWSAIAKLLPLSPRRLVLGGGGYNPWSVARAWVGVWAMLNGIAIPERLPEPAEAILRSLAWSRSQGRNPPEHWFTTLADPPVTAKVRYAVRALVGPALS